MILTDRVGENLGVAPDVPATGGRDDAGMSTTGRLPIEVEVGPDAPCGAARDATGRVTAFSGRLELIAVIEAPVTTGAASNAGARRGTGGVGMRVRHGAVARECGAPGEVIAGGGRPVNGEGRLPSEGELECPQF